MEIDYAILNAQYSCGWGDLSEDTLSASFGSIRQLQHAAGVLWCCCIITIIIAHDCHHTHVMMRIT
jgi:hypothetical protein